MKVSNQNWEKINVTPVEIKIRNELGVAVNKEDLVNVSSTVKDLFNNGEKYKQKIDEYFKTFTFNHGTAAAKGATYILNSIVEKKKNAKK